MISATDSIRWLSGMGVSSHGKMPIISGQTHGIPAANQPPEDPAAALFEDIQSQRRSTPDQAWPAPSGAGAAFDGAVGTVRIDVERTGSSFDHFARNHNLFDAFKPRQIEHGLKQDALEDRTQSP